MIKLIYITSDEDHVSQLQEILGGDFVVHQSLSNDIDDFGESHAVICDINSSNSDNPKWITTIKDSCLNKRIPLYLSAADEILPDVHDILNGLNCNNMIEYPFRDYKIQCLIDKLKGNEEFSIEDKPGLIDILFKSVDDFFTVVINHKIKLNRHYISSDCKLNSDLSGYVILTGDVNGLLAMSFDKNIVARVCSAIGECDQSILTDNCYMEATKEILNQIAGQLRNRICAANCNVIFSLPYNTSTDSLSLPAHQSSVCYNLEFEIDNRIAEMHFLVVSNQLDKLPDLNREHTPA